MEDDFDLNIIPTSNLYSESEETKQLRHQLYEKQNKIFGLKIACNISTALGILLLIIGFIRTLYTNINKQIQNNISSTPNIVLFVFGTIILIAGIIMGICIKTYSDNTLEPIKQDIKRSQLNDQLELAGANVNRKRKPNNKDFEDDDSFTDLKDELEDLKEEYEILNNNLSKLQKENSELKQSNKILKNKNSELQAKYNKLINTKTLTKNINNTNSSLNIEVDENKSSGKGILISLLVISIITFIISLVFTIINFKAQKDILFIIIPLVSTLITFFAIIIFGILLFPTKEKFNQQ